jgi:hypothetical protein
LRTEPRAGCLAPPTDVDDAVFRQTHRRSIEDGGAAAELSKQSVKEGILIRDLVLREKLLTDAEIDDVLDLKKMTEIGVPGGVHGAVSAG